MQAQPLIAVRDVHARKFDAHLATTGRAVRALDSFGDFIIVVLVPRERLAAFDAANEYWSA